MDAPRLTLSSGLGQVHVDAVTRTSWFNVDGVYLKYKKNNNSAQCRSLQAARSSVFIWMEEIGRLQSSPGIDHAASRPRRLPVWKDSFHKQCTATPKIKEREGARARESTRDKITTTTKKKNISRYVVISDLPLWSDVPPALSKRSHSAVTVTRIWCGEMRYWCLRHTIKQTLSTSESHSKRKREKEKQEQRLFAALSSYFQKTVNSSCCKTPTWILNTPVRLN